MGSPAVRLLAAFSDFVRVREARRGQATASTATVEEKDKAILDHFFAQSEAEASPLTVILGSTA